MVMFKRQRHFRHLGISERLKNKLESLKRAVRVNEIVAIVNESGIVCL